MEERPSSSSSSSSHDTFLSSLLVLGGNPFRPFDICDFSGRCKWTVAVARSSKTAKAEPVFSPKFSIGGYACRLVFYPKGDPACQDRFSFHIQITDPTNHRWDCFAFFKIFIINHLNMLNSVCKESGDRFTDRKTSHGCKFTRSSILDPKLGFYFDDSLLIVVEIRVLKDLLWCRDNNDLNSASDVLSGNYTWKIQNFSVFQEVIATQRITSPVIKAGPFNLALSLSQSVFNGVECLSLYLEGKGASFWCLFRLSVLSQKVDGHVHKTLSERLGLEVILVRTRKVGWGDYMKMSELVNLDNGFLFDDAVEISVSYFVIKDFFHLSKNVGFLAGSRARGPKKHDEYAGKITWKIGNFTKLKDLLRKKKIKGIHVRSERVLIGNRHCSLVVYPRGKSQPPSHVSVFLEVTDSQFAPRDWSSSVFYQLSLVNQRMEDKSITKESQSRYPEDSKYGGWSEFVTLTSLFDQDSGFLVEDTIVLSADILILKETFLMQEKLDSSITGVPLIPDRKARAFEWKVENFLSFKGLMETQKIFSKYFQIGECEFRIGFRKSLDALCAYMECDPSVVNDPDKNFWVSYSLTLVNQKSPDRNVLAKASFFTRIGNSSVEFMKVSDMLKAHGGFLVRETVVFLGEILDCCPWFEFSSLEVLACDNDQDALLTDPVNIINSKDKVFNGDVKEFFGILLARAGFCPGGSSLQPQFPTEILVDAGRIDTFLKDINAYLNDPLGPKHFLPSTLPYGSNDGKQQATTADGSSMTLTEVKLWLKVLQQAIVDELLDIMVDCCQPSDRKSNDPCNGNEAMNQSEYNGENGVADCVQSPIFARVGSRMDETINSYTEKCFDMITTDLPEEATPGLAISSPEMTADVPVVFCCIKNSKIKRSEQAEDILGLIFNYLKACPDPQGCPEVTQRPQSAQNISFILNEAPRHLLPDLVTLVPKLVDHSKLPVAACMLLDQLKKPNVEPALHPLVLDAVSQMDFGNEVWEQVILKALELLMNSNDESLDRTISFLFKAASQCGHITLVVQVVQVSLRRFGDHISPRALDYLCKTVNNCSDIAITMLKKINFAFGLNDKCLKNCSFPLWYGENEMLSKRMNLEDEQQLHANCHFSDIYILIEMLSIPSLAVEASQTFEKAFAQGLIDEHLMEMVLARRQAQLLTVDYMSFSEKYSHKDIVVEGKVKSVPVEEVDSTLVLGLAEKFAFSDDPNVHESGIMLYAMLYKLFSGEDYRRRMLKGLVDRATSLTENNFEVDTVLDILVSLVNTGQVVAEVVLQMMREVVEQANVDCATYRHQLRASEDEKIHIREEKLAELSNIVRETAILFERISDSEISIDLLKSEMVHKMEHFALERTEILEQLQEVENQLGRLYSKSDGVIAKLSNEKKNYEDRLNDLETQLSQLKSQTSDELKIAVTEKNALSAMLESVESGTRRFDEELKCYAANAQILVEAQNSLEGEVEQLKEKHEQIESEKREKQELVMKYTTHIHNLDASLNSYQQRIQALEAELEVEKSQHAPLYGYGLEALSAKELETVSRIHVEGLRDIHAFIQRRYGIGSSSINPNTHPNPLMVCPTATTPMAVGLPYLPTSNGSQIHDIGGIVSQWDPGSCARKFFRHDHRDP